MPSLPNTIREALPEADRRKDVARLDERGPVPSRARERDRAGRASWSGRRGSARGRLVIGEVHQLVLAEARMQREIHEPRETGGLHLGHACDRRRIEHAVANDTQSAWTLRHEHRAVGKKRHAPGLVEPFGDRQSNLTLDGGVEDDGAVREGGRRPVDRRRRRRRASRAPSPRTAWRLLTASAAARRGGRLTLWKLLRLCRLLSCAGRDDENGQSRERPDPRHAHLHEPISCLTTAITGALRLAPSS